MKSLRIGIIAASGRRDDNEPPIAIALTAVITTIVENTVVGGGILVATITVTDDGIGTNNLAVIGADAADFEIRNGSEVFFIGSDPDFETKASYVFAVTVDDPAVGGTPDATSADFTLTVTDVNEAPVIAGDLAATVDQGGSVVITEQDLFFTDPDDGPGDVTFFIFSEVNGEIRVSGSPASQFTGQDILDGNVSFTHDGSATTSASFEVGVDDGDEDGSAVTLSTFTLSINIDIDISTAVFVQSLDVTPQDNAPRGVAFNSDGTQMFVLGTEFDSVYAYDLGTAFDIGSAAFVQSFSVAAQDTLPTGVAFSPDGTQMFVTALSTDAVHAYDLGTAFDIGTAVFVQSFSVASQDQSPTGVTFSPDGSQMFVVGATSDAVHAYDLGTAFDIGTAAFVQSFSVASQDEAPRGVAFSSDGTQMFVSGVIADSVHAYDLGAAFDIGTAVFVQSFSVAAEDDAPTGLTFNPDGSQMFITGFGADSVHQYALAVRDLNEAPAAVVLSQILFDIDEGTDNSTGVKVADITITDDGRGTNVLATIGNDAGSFEVRNQSGDTAELFFIEDPIVFADQSSYSVAVTVDDPDVGSTPDATSATITLDVTEVVVNVPPVLIGDLTATVGQGGSVVITEQDLFFTDPDDGPGEVTFFIFSEVNGEIQVNGSPANQFTGQDILDGNVSFAHDDSATTTASFEVFIEDGNEDGSPPVTSIFNLTVNPTGLQLAGSIVLNGVDERLQIPSFSSVGPNQRQFTVAFWVNLSGDSATDFAAILSMDNTNLAQYRVMFDFSATPADPVILESVDLDFEIIDNERFTSERAFAPNAQVAVWSHYTISVDKDAADAADIVRLFENGQLLPANEDVSTESTLMFQNGFDLNIGFDGLFNDFFLFARLADLIVVEGQALLPDEVNYVSATGGWKDYTGTFGNHGFRLNPQNDQEIGLDQSGNGNDFTLVNMDASNFDPNDIPPT
ncbi:MAG: cadherin-like domain-containing protein [Pseudomonadota bacterium]